MKSMFITIPAGLLMVLMLNACGTTYRVEELAAEQKEVDGLPFRIKENYKIDVYRKVPGKRKYERIGSVTKRLPNPDLLYVLKLRGGMFADSTTTFSLNPDGTLKTLEWGSTPKGPEALTAAGEQTKAVAEALAAAEEKKKAAESESRDASTAADDALDAVRIAEAELLDVLANPAATRTERTAKEVALTKAKREANKTAVDAGRVPPFPDFPLQ